MKLLEVQDVHTYYGDSHVLKGVNLEVETGAVVAVLGRNGMGKTTLMRTVMGLTPARRGRILYQGVDIAHLPTYKIARLGLGYVPQGRRLFVSLTTKENLIVFCPFNQITLLIVMRYEGNLFITVHSYFLVIHVFSPPFHAIAFYYHFFVDSSS